MKYALKKARDVIFADTVSDQAMATVNDITDIKLSNGADTVDANGSDGAILAVFDTKKTAQVTITNGAIDSSVMALQSGTTEETVSNGTDVRFRESFSIKDSATSVTLSHKASGKAGNEIKFVYKADSNGNPGKSYAQGATASATQFSYDASTKVITLPTGVFVNGDIVIIDYYPVYEEYQHIGNSSNEFSGTYKVIINGWFTDLCSQKDVPLQMVCPRGKVSGKYDLEFGDKAAVQNITIDAQSLACANSNHTLWDCYTYDNSKIVDD